MIISEDFLGGPAVKNLPAVQKAQETQVPSLGQRSPGGGHGNPLHCSCLENPWTEEPGGLHGGADSDTTEATEHAHSD